ncbi:MAG: hypothetical protein HRT61_10270, partial [Ekhidna sp.]|nr:hypothetical protein [Ekhidna sp.]
MRLKIFAAFLGLTTALTPVPAHAGIVTGIVSLVSTVANAVGVSVAGQAIIGQALFAATGSIGAALASAALSFALNAFFVPDAQQPTPQETQSNFMLEEAPRFWISGRQRQGGTITFAEVSEGRIYKCVAHGDCELTSIENYYLNDKNVSIDSSGRVQNSAYRDGTTEKYFLESRSGKVNQSAMSRLVSNFPEWTENHKGAGVCDTLLRVGPVSDALRSKLLKHSGALRLGEPDVTVDGWYGRYYDPRNDSTNGGEGDERVDDSTTWGVSYGNAALVIIQHRLDPERFANSPDDINWPNIIEQANICDEIVFDKYSNSAPRYRIGITVNKKSERNIDAENRMLSSCDAIRWQNDEGKFGLFVGKYDATPDLVLTDSDIIEIESRDGEDGENLFTHYFASYTEPSFNMKGTQSGALASPDFVDGEDDVSTKEVSLYPIQNHNQAIRVLNAGVRRQHEKLRLGVVAGLRALEAKRTRFLRLDVTDAVLSGRYEIANVTDSYDG